MGISEENFYLEDLKSKFDKINFDDYYLSYSGGRDSHFLYWFIKEYLHDDKIEIVGINTGLEIKEISNRINSNCDTILRPSMKPFDIKEKFGIPCVSKSQDEMVYEYRKQVAKGKVTKHYIERVEQALESKSFFKINNKLYNALFSGSLHPISHLCCKYLKKFPARNYEEKTNKKPILGTMAEESLQRKSSLHSCFTKKGYFYPLWDFTTNLEKNIEKIFDIEVPEIYNFVDQTGCVGCPYGIKRHKNAKQNSFCFASTQQQKFLIEYFKESYEFHGFKYWEFVNEN